METEYRGYTIHRNPETGTLYFVRDDGSRSPEATQESSIKFLIDRYINETGIPTGYKFKSWTGGGRNVQ